MHIYTLGKLGLVGSTFREPVPLLVLVYLALQGRTQRSRLADLLWVALDEPKKRLASLSEAVYRLRKLYPDIVRGNEEWLETTATVDVQPLREAVAQKNSPLASELYQGHFLDGTERNPRFTFGEEMNEWIINTREELYSDVFELRLWWAERTAYAGNFKEAANLAWQVYARGTNITYLALENYQRLHKLFTAAERFDEASRIYTESKDLYGPDTLYLCANPTEAKLRLTHSYGLRAENPSFVDREKDTETMLRLLARHRLVSMVGAPGIGKTELAQVMGRLGRGQPFSEDGVHVLWLETVPASTPTPHFITVFAKALGVKASTLEELAAVIRDSKRLLVLDNFEHLNKTYGFLLLELQRLCPGLRLLVTSRELLRLAGECAYLLDYLPYPDENMSLEEANTYASVQLFERSAPGFQLSESTFRSVIQICAMVEGLPLGIKLAASWAGTLSPSVIAERLAPRLELLQHGEGHGRHDSIHAALESSLALLSPIERFALTKLSVFQSDFSLMAAQHVTEVTLPVLRSLIEKSLLSYDQESERYSFHALIGEYMYGLLEQAETSQKVKTSHATYYLDRLEQLPTTEAEAKRHLVHLLGNELKNVETAWLFAVERGWFARLYVTCKALQQFGEMTARYKAVEALLAKALADCPEEDVACATALASNLALMRYRLGKYHEAIELTDMVIGNLKKGVIDSEDRALSIAQQAYTTQAFSYSSLADFPKTLELAQKIHDMLLEKAPNSVAYAESLVNLAFAEKNILGHYDLEPYNKALEIFEAKIQQDNIAWVLVLAAMCLIHQHQLKFAKPLLERASRISENLYLSHWLAMSKYYQARILLLESQYSDAETLCEQLLAQAERQNKISLLAIIWRLRGEIEWSRPEGNLEKALEYLDNALSHAHAISDVALVQGILVDRLGCFLGGERLIEAAAIYPLIKSKVSQLYYVDKQKLDRLLQQYGDTSTFLLD